MNEQKQLRDMDEVSRWYTFAPESANSRRFVYMWEVGGVDVLVFDRAKWERAKGAGACVVPVKMLVFWGRTLRDFRMWCYGNQATEEATLDVTDMGAACLGYVQLAAF